MRFITEFEMAEGNPRNPDILIKAKKDSEDEMGRAMANAFGWEERGETTLYPNSPIALKYKLAIEAFPMDKWIEFKNKLITEFEGLLIEQQIISKMFKELESFGKPSGDYNIPDNPPTALTGVKTYFDSKDGKVYRQTPDGEVEDITTDKPSGDAITNQQP